MKKFLAIFLGTQAAMDEWKKLSEAERNRREAEGMKAWYAWDEKHKHAILDEGHPLGKTKAVSASGIRDIKNAMAVYVLVQAESHEAAAKLFEGHPHFTVFAGESIEVMECLPLPPPPQ